MQLLRSALPRRALLHRTALTGLALGFPQRALWADSATSLAPVPVLALSPSSPVVPRYLSVLVDESTVARPIENYIWDWGDGTPPKHGRINYHYYHESGTYSVTLTAIAGDESWSSTSVVDVPWEQRTPSTWELMERLQTALREELPRGNLLHRLADDATRIIDAAGRRARGTHLEQFQAIALQTAAGKIISSMTDKFRAEVSNEDDDDRFRSLTLDHAVPVLLALSRDTEMLSDFLFLECNDGDFNDGECNDGDFDGSFGGFGAVSGGSFRAAVCRAACDLDVLAISAAIGAVAFVGIIDCAVVAFIPIIGPVLAAGCVAGVGVLVSRAIEATNEFYNGCIEDCNARFGP